MTLIDYPDKVAATVFLFGCNFRCPYCHNPELVDPDWENSDGRIRIARAQGAEARFSDADFFKFLRERIGFLDGVCITGGEPTIHSDLPKFIQKIKKSGFLVKLDTNGSNPEMLKNLVKNNLVDFIAMDIKTSILKYEKVYPVKSREAGAAEQLFNGVKKSINIIKNSNQDYEFRTTVVPGIVEEKDIQEMAELLKGSKKIALQQFRNQKVLNKEFETLQPYSKKTLKEFKKILEKYIPKVELRL